MAIQKNEKILGRAAGAVGAAEGGALGPGAAPITLGLFLLPSGRPGRRLIGAVDEDPAAARVVLFLFLLPAGTIFYNGVKFCTQQTIISKEKT
jgi:hypothetical protein